MIGIVSWRENFTEIKEIKFPVKILIEADRGLTRDFLGVCSQTADLELSSCGQEVVKIFSGGGHLPIVEQGQDGLEVAGVGIGNGDGDGACRLVFEEGGEERGAGREHNAVGRNEDIFTDKSNIRQVRLLEKLVKKTSNSWQLVSLVQRAAWYS